jgi:hypothetical protein
MLIMREDTMSEVVKFARWRLDAGSHDRPQPDGSTCITEAAIVAAGFPYTEIESVSDCPPCFSRPITHYAIVLNETMLFYDDLRRRLLMPFITRLAGTADAERVEVRRGRFMALETCRRVMPLFCNDILQRPDLARRCEIARGLKEAYRVCRKVKAAAYSPDRKASCDSDAKLINRVVASATSALEYAVYFRHGRSALSVAAFAADAVGAASFASPAWASYLTIGTQILDEAILLGKHPTLDLALVNRRLMEAKRETAA